jgi:ribosomal-protein-serine acetyltransferase
MFESKLTDDLQLHLVNDSCVPDYVRLAKENFDYLAKWLEWPRFCVSNEDFSKFIIDSIDSYKAGKSMNCAIRYKGALAGVAGFNKIDRKLCRVEIGYWIGAGFQGNGIATEICRFLTSYAFETLQLDVVKISVAEENVRSRAVCERLGMKLEGIISNEERIGDNVLNHAVYSVRRKKFLAP